MVTTLQETEELLRGIDPDSLREMVYEVAHSHSSVCQLTSQVGGSAHIGADETRDRINALTVSEMAGILAPTVWISLRLDGLLGR